MRTRLAGVILGTCALVMLVTGVATAGASTPDGRVVAFTLWHPGSSLPSARAGEAWAALPPSPATKTLKPEMIGHTRTRKTGRFSFTVPMYDRLPAAARASAEKSAGGRPWRVVTPAVAQSSPVAGSCTQVRRELAADRARGMSRVACVEPSDLVPSVNLPSLCHLNHEHFNRFADCRDDGWLLTIIDVETGDPVGSVAGSTVLWNSLAYNSRSWTEHIRLAIVAVVGKGAGTTITAPIECSLGSSGCRPNGHGIWAGQLAYLPAEIGKVYSGDLGWESPGRSTNTMRLEVNMIFDNAVANPAPLRIGPTSKVRCDSESIFRPTKGGCVHEDATQNVLVLSKADTSIAEAAVFMADAQRAIHNHAGWLGHGRALTRLTNSSAIRRNRRVACRGVRLGHGQSCDEYPFASTNQGAALVPRDDFDSKALNAAQNSKVGSYLGSFLLHLRIAAGDSYYVEIVG